MRRLAYLFPWLFLTCAIACVQFVEPGTFSSKAHAQFVSSGLYNSGQATNSGGGGGGGYTGPLDSSVVPGAQLFYSVRSPTAAYATGSNSTITIVMSVIF